MRLKLALAFAASFVAAPVAAADEARGIYLGAFGGMGAGGDADITQSGVVFFTEAVGGPLVVEATGQADGDDTSFFGGQVGYEFAHSSAVLTAFELEGIFLDNGTSSATLDNSNIRNFEESFDVTFPTETSVFLANMVLSFPTSFHGLTPYVGAGLGGARVTIDGAVSLQTDPTEGALNHYSDTESEAWTFAGQLKAGLRIALGSNAYAFGEYRYLHVGSTDQSFGSTIDAGHAPTSAWDVGFDGASHHLASAGIGFRF